MKTSIVAAILAFLLIGCKTTEPIYYHGSYTNAVYQYLKNDELSIDQQIQMLEQIIEQAANEDKQGLPGVHSHLCLLYFDSGNPDLGTSHFNIEQNLFPESKLFLDFLINQGQNGTNDE